MMNLNSTNSKIALACFVFLAALFITGDLVVAGYALMVAGVLGYFVRSTALLLKMMGVFLLVSLFYPLIGVQLTIVFGFIGLLFIFKKALDGRFSFLAALIFLIFCPFLLAVNQDKIAEYAAIFTFYFLTAGTLQEVAALALNHE